MQLEMKGILEENNKIEAGKSGVCRIYKYNLISHSMFKGNFRIGSMKEIFEPHFPENSGAKASYLKHLIPYLHVVVLRLRTSAVFEYLKLMWVF